MTKTKNIVVANAFSMLCYNSSPITFTTNIYKEWCVFVCVVRDVLSFSTHFGAAFLYLFLAPPLRGVIVSWSSGYYYEGAVTYTHSVCISRLLISLGTYLTYSKPPHNPMHTPTLEFLAIDSLLYKGANANNDPILRSQIRGQTSVCAPAIARAGKLPGVIVGLRTHTCAHATHNLA